MIKNIISLGAGVQSSTMALMAALGEITPMPDAAIFADTQDEPEEVYSWLSWLKERLPFPVYQVTAGNLMEIQLQKRISGKTGNVYFRNLIPAFVAKEGGGRAILGRKCTAEFKVREIVKKAKQIVGKEALASWKEDNKPSWDEYRAYDVMRKAAKSKAKFPFDAFNVLQTNAPCRQWIGISLDEIKRMKRSTVPWAKSIFPLVELRMTREDCLSWMRKQGFPEPPRSACKKCPFHSNEEWLRQKTESPDDFAESVAYDKNLRELHQEATGTAKLQGLVYLHDSLKPLDEVDFSKKPEDKAQRMLSFLDECSGMCGV